MELNKTTETDDRVSRAIRQAKREACMGDALTFGFGRAWSVLLIVGATFAAVCGRVALGVDTMATDGPAKPDAPN
jgi:hypothetical protein